MVLLACTTFLFAGAYLSSLIVPGAVLVVLTLLYRPWRAPGAAPPLHRWLIAIAAMMALQLVPLPELLIDRLSPAARGIWQSLSLTPVRGALPLSVDLTATLRALAIGGGSLLVFVLSRQVFTAGGVRIAVRGVATIGLVLSAISLAQNATSHGLIYWRWDPGEGPAPFGPFLNRNHFATWIVLAVPMCFGYLLAHSAAHRPHDKPSATWHRRVLRLLDARSIWLRCAICLMLVALVLFVRESAAALARDDSGMYYLRAGACCGLAGVAVQSIWETGLTSPANGVLAAIVAAVVVHHAAPRARAEAEA